jgi:hypothetical protein
MKHRLELALELVMESAARPTYTEVTTREQEVDTAHQAGRTVEFCIRWWLRTVVRHVSKGCVGRVGAIPYSVTNLVRSSRPG